MADKVDDLADLELMDELELMASDSDEARSESLGSKNSDSDNEGEESDDDGPRGITEEHYAALRATVVDIVTALGGLEDVASEDGSIETVYAIGDDCLRCLRDLRSLLHHDQDDHARTVPRIFGEVNVVQRGLLPLLLKTADMGERGSKIALACTDILTSLTWPIDAIAEQQAIIQKDGDMSALDSLSHMQKLLVSYKLAVIKSKSEETRGCQRSVLNTVMLHILLPSLSKSRHARTERDTGIISMCLHLFRNLLAIKDPFATSLSSHEQIVNSNLQNDLIREMHGSHILDTFLMLASNASTKDYEPWNVVAAECVVHLFVGANPASLLPPQPVTSRNGWVADKNTTSTSSSSCSLQKLLASENEEKRSMMLAGGASRHSRYTTTIKFRDAHGELRTALSQSSLRKDSERLQQQWKEKTTRHIRRRKKLDEPGATRLTTQWSGEVVNILRAWAQKFLKVGLESLVQSVVKDLRSESAKAGDHGLTRVRIMQISIFFLNYFLLLREQAELQENHSPGLEGGNGVSNLDEWSFDLISYWLEPWALKMAWMRSADAREDKAWLEFLTAVRLWTTILRIVEALGKSKIVSDQERADGIQAVHFYDELALDTAKAVTRSFTSQSFKCLETIVEFSYVMPRLLEKYSKDKDNLYIKAKRQMRQKRQDGIEDGSEDQQAIRKSVEDQIKERKFEFEKFQRHISSTHLVEACLALLQRWREIRDRAEDLVSAAIHVLHRLVVKTGMPRLLYPHRHRTALKSLQQQSSLWQMIRARAPQVEDDAQKLIKYILSKFDRLDDSEKAMWAEGMKGPKPVKIFKMPPEIEIRPSRGREEDIRIAVGLLVERDLLRVVSWVKSGLEEAARIKSDIVQEERRKESSVEDDGDLGIPREALERFADFHVSYHDNDSVREDASTRPEAKLLCRLLDLQSNEDDDHHWRWHVPAHRLPEAVEQDAELLDSAIRFPTDLFGERFDSLVSRVRKMPQRRRTTVDDNGDEVEVYVPRGRGIHKGPRNTSFIDDDIIEDSDEEMEAVARLMAQSQANASAKEKSKGEIHSRLSHGEDDDLSESGSEAEMTGLRNRSSPSRTDESSATSPSAHSPSQASKRPQKRKRRLASVSKQRARKTNALFLESDSEEDAEHHSSVDPSQDGNVTDKRLSSTAPGTVSSPSGRVRVADHDDESQDGEENRVFARALEPAHFKLLDGPADTTIRPPLSTKIINDADEGDDNEASIVRKRRALIVDDDDDD